MSHTTRAPNRRRLTGPERREVIERTATELFAERGYHGTSMDEIARRAGVSAPVLYDHFESKQDLHRSLLERHFAELRALWHDHMLRDEPLEDRLARGLDAWFAYVQSHPFAWRMLFRDTTGDPAVQAVHEEVARQSRALMLPLLARERGLQNIAGPSEELLDMAWEVLRGVLQGLALWWYEHQHVPREQVVATAMNAIWIGFDRVRRGEVWQP